MNSLTIKKLRSKRGSGIAEALVGFLISVLSVMMILGIVTTTRTLVSEGDKSMELLYQEEAAMNEFHHSGTADTGSGDLYEIKSGAPLPQSYTVTVTGDPTGGGTPVSRETNVKYYITKRHHLFGFASN